MCVYVCVCEIMTHTYADTHSMCIFKHMSRNTYMCALLPLPPPNQPQPSDHPPLSSACPLPLFLPSAILPQLLGSGPNNEAFVCDSAFAFLLLRHTHAHVHTHMAIVSYWTTDFTRDWRKEKGSRCLDCLPPLPGVFICASNLRIIAALITFTSLYDKRKKQQQQQQKHQEQQWK